MFTIIHAQPLKVINEVCVSGGAVYTHIYSGCFKDQGMQRALREENINLRKNATIENCVHHCITNGNF